MRGIYFAPGTECLAAIKYAMEHAVSEIDIAMYQFTDSKIWEYMKAASNRGVIVRLILDKQSSRRWSAIWIRFLIWTLHPTIIVAISNKPGLMHHNFVVTDNGFVLTGSYNWTAVSRKKNNENMIFSDGYFISGDYQNRFEDLWEDYYMGNVLISGGPLGQPSSGDLRNCDIATQSIAGVESAADKTKLDGIEAGAQKNVAHAASHIQTGSDPIAESTPSVDGLISAADKTKLNGIEASADVTDAGNIATAIAGTTETTPLDADEIPFWKAAGTALKKVLWSTLKTTLFTAFDTLAAGVKGWCPALPNPTDTTKYLNGAGAFTTPAGSASVLVQEVYVNDVTCKTAVTVIPLDDSLPQISEGTEVMTLAITPTNANNKLVVEVVANVAISLDGNAILGALFNTDLHATNAQAACICYANSNSYHQMILRYEVVAGRTTATIFRFRIGQNGALTVSFNGQAVRKLGGAMVSSMRISEIKV